MALHAVRERGQLVDFELDNACAAAFRLLRGETLSLLGQRLAQVLAWHDRRLTVFDHYRRVVEFGSARAVTASVAVNARVEVLRHAALRTHDGVAVTLTNVSAVRRVLALEREIESRVELQATRPRSQSALAHRPLHR
jgi:hypothetical protein